MKKSSGLKAKSSNLTANWGRIREDYTKKIAAINQKKQTAATLANQARNALRSAEIDTARPKNCRRRPPPTSPCCALIDQVTDSTMPDKETRVTI
jgi:hypothetical protein